MITQRVAYSQAASTTTPNIFSGVGIEYIGKASNIDIYAAAFLAGALIPSRSRRLWAAIRRSSSLPAAASTSTRPAHRSRLMVWAPTRFLPGPTWCSRLPVTPQQARTPAISCLW